MEDEDEKRMSVLQHIRQIQAASPFKDCEVAVRF